LDLELAADHMRYSAPEASPRDLQPRIASDRRPIARQFARDTLRQLT